jgi:hypothetical protein
MRRQRSSDSVGEAVAAYLYPGARPFCPSGIGGLELGDAAAAAASGAPARVLCDIGEAAGPDRVKLSGSHSTCSDDAGQVGETIANCGLCEMGSRTPTLASTDVLADVLPDVLCACMAAWSQGRHDNVRPESQGRHDNARPEQQGLGDAFQMWEHVRDSH